MTQQQPSNHIPEAKKMVPGDELHLTLLMAPFSLNFFTGQDRQHLLAFGRAAFEAGQAAAQQAVQADACAQDVFNDGVSIGLFDIPKHTANAICSGINAVTGARVDWHDIGGRVHLKALPATHPTQQGMDAIAALQKVRDIAVSALLTGSLDRQDWIDDMDRIAAQAKQGGAA